jgi:hypothetical protein
MVAYYKQYILIIVKSNAFSKSPENAGQAKSNCLIRPDTLKKI